MYRFYFIAKNGHIDRPPGEHDLPDDRAAIKEARQLVDGHDIEIWQEARLVAYVRPDTKEGSET